MARFLTPFRPYEASREDPFLDFPREMNRLFGDVVRGMGLAPLGEQARMGLAAPRIDVNETERTIEISAELPGVSPQEVDVRVDDDILTIRGEKRCEREEGGKGQSHVSERFYGAFQRAIQLPFSPDPEEVKARFEKGVLTIELPKEGRQERSHKIAIEGAGSGEPREAASGEGAPARTGNGGRATETERRDQAH